MGNGSHKMFENLFSQFPRFGGEDAEGMNGMMRLVMMMRESGFRFSVANRVALIFPWLHDYIFNQFTI